MNSPFSPFSGYSAVRDSRSGRDVGVDNQRISDRLRRLENQYASQIPIDPITGISADTVQAALEELIGSGAGGSVQSPTADYTIVTGDRLILVDASGGAVDITLPTVARQVVTIKKIDATGNAVTVSGGANIDGMASVVLTVPMSSLTLGGDDSAWWIL